MAKMNSLVLVALPLFFLHTLEEYFFNFIETDASIGWLANMFDVSRTNAYWTVQVLVYVYLLLLIYNPARKIMYVPLGVIFVVEIHHIWETVTQWNYASGFWTSIPLVILGAVFWKALLAKHAKQN